ncbi:MAG: hypothetical protein GXO03_01495 [Aquificae bacterium]|nr:hypothetical protein [Aquificota bacterium]
MKRRRATELLTLLVWFFVAFNLLPYAAPELYAPKEKLAPRPFARKVFFYFGARDPSLAVEAKRRGVTLVLGFFERDEPPLIRIRTVPACRFLFPDELPVPLKLAVFLADYLPFKLVGGRAYAHHHRLEPSRTRCNLLFTETLPPVFKDFALNAARNAVYKRYTEPVKLGRSSFYASERKLEVYAYSPMSFYFPGERTVYPFKLFVRSNEPKSLIIIYRNGRPYRAYEERSVVTQVREPGVYSVAVYAYRLRLGPYFLGLRLVAQSAPVELIE